MVRLLIILCCLLCATESQATRSIAGNETWSGKVAVKETVVIPRGSALTILAGTELLFAGDSSLVVEGRLVAKGSAEKPIILRPAAGSPAGTWQGISFQNAVEAGDLSQLRIEGAAQGLTVVGSKVRLSRSTISGGRKGIVLAAEANVLIEGVTLRQMSEGGIDASVHATGEIRDCRIEEIAGFAIQAEKQATLKVHGNRISGAKFGILMNGEFPPLEDNRLDHCEVGIGLLQASPATVVRGNRVTASKIGIACRQFASPILERNDIGDCEVGIDCFQGASPVIRNNRLAHNKQGIRAVQMCNPVVTENELTGNETGIYLHLSSYAQIHRNNFDANRLHIELDNMSYDWEVRAGNKPKRNLQAKNEFLVKQGRAAPEKIKVSVDSVGFVDARDNFWGKTTTAEMAAKGDQADISTFHDGFDEPTRSYDGWPGEYLIDKIHYDGWRREPLAAAGLAAAPQ